jgi:DNA mismatch repair ATPase MutS
VSAYSFYYELGQLGRFLSLAKAIRYGAKENLFAPVEFHGGREILIEDGWNIAKLPSEQVSYDRNFYTDQQVEFSVGANMSGKSFDMCGLTWSLQFAQATGWAPGSKAYLPIFDQIIHIERVPERKDLNLSALGTEVHYWKEVVSAIQSGDQIYLAADEPFSSTPSYYRDPFNFSIAALAAENGTVATIATHCQKPARHFVEANPGLARATHHKTSFDQAGNLVSEYKKRNGFDDSNALRVARALGFPQEILEIASGVDEVN